MKILVTQVLMDKASRLSAEEIFLKLVDMKERQGMMVINHREIKAKRTFSTKIYEFEDGSVLYLTENEMSADSKMINKDIDIIIVVEALGPDKIVVYNYSGNCGTGEGITYYAKDREGHQWKRYKECNRIL